MWCVCGVRVLSCACGVCVRGVCVCGVVYVGVIYVRGACSGVCVFGVGVGVYEG